MKPLMICILSMIHCLGFIFFWGGGWLGRGLGLLETPIIKTSRKIVKLLAKFNQQDTATQFSAVFSSLRNVG